MKRVEGYLYAPKGCMSNQVANRNAKRSIISALENFPAVPLITSLSALMWIPYSNTLASSSSASPSLLTLFSLFIIYPFLSELSLSSLSIFCWRGRSAGAVQIHPTLVKISSSDTPSTLG